MKFPKDLVPQKVVAEELCTSLITLWRARNSGIAGFPAPVVYRGLVCWRRSDLAKLEDALMYFRGRVVFERDRRARKQEADLRQKVRAGRPRPRGKPRPRRRPENHPDLFT